MKKINWIILSILTLLMIQTASFAYGADFLSQIHPYISVVGGYDDNLNLTRNNTKQDFFTTITPGVTFDNMDAQSGIKLDANVGAVLYKEYSNLNYMSGNVNLDTKYLTSSHFNFYLKDSFIRSDSPREREFFTTTQDNKYFPGKVTERSVYLRNVVLPTVEYQFGPESRAGITYRNNVYQITAAGGENSMENYINPFITYWIDKQNGVSLNYAYTNGHFEISPDFNSHKMNASYMLRFTPKATAFLNGAYTKLLYSVENMDYEIYEPSLGISYLFSPTLSASAQAGYYWMDSKKGNNNGFTFKADITQKDVHTTYVISLQGGYLQDYFTSSNQGFVKYYRATGTIAHFLARQLSIGCLGSVEWSEGDPALASDQPHRNLTWGAGANLSYMPFKWLTVSLGYMHNQRNANYRYEATDEYIENIGMLTVTATYL